MKLITLLTDFGYQDPFVGIMKGVIFGINPEARVIDLSHEVPPQDVLAGALSLQHSAPYFPRGAIHVAVVDPGVGSQRRSLLVESEGNFFIGPDNGILSLAIEGKEVDRIIDLCDDRYHLKPTSVTFHGRDIFAPVAAHLSRGTPPQELGKKVDSLTRLDWPKIGKTERTIEGRIIYTDRFGNLVTNVRERDLNQFNPASLQISVGNVALRGLSANYTAGANGSCVALINSWGLLEIALFKGDARSACGAKVGDAVRLQES